MGKRVKNEKGETQVSAIGIFTGIFTGFLLSVMAAMMYIGGGINFQEFLNAGDVYDFSQKTLKSPSKGWLYDGESQGYWLQNNHALKKYMLNGREKCWGYLYLNIPKMGLPDMQARVIYYNRGNQPVGEQPVLLHEGENIILLQEDTAMYRMGIRILDAKGQFISIQSMQIRTKASGYTARRFLKVFGTAYAGFLVLFGCFLIFGKAAAARQNLWQRAEKCYLSFVEVLQYIYQVFTGKTGEKASGRLSKKKKGSMRVYLFGLLFFWMVAGNVLNWSGSEEFYRYHVSLCLILLFAIAIISWEKPLRQAAWKNPLAVSWICLWAGMAISDFFVKKDFGMAGCAMLLGGGYFIFAWCNMEKKDEMLYNMLDALGKTFWIAVAYCMLFRLKKPGIHYNGIFRSSEEFSIYAALMLSVFLFRIDGDIKNSIGGKNHQKEYALHISGGAAALYFVLRSGNLTGIIIAAVLIGLFAKRQLCLASLPFKKICKVLACILKGSVTAFLLVCAVHVSTKNLPALLDSEVIYEKELLTTGVDDEMKEALNDLEPGLMDGVKQEKDAETRVVQKNYIRKWNLFGNEESRLKVFRAYASPDSGYIYIAYKYGLFLLVPYVIFQLCILGKGARSYLKKRENAAEIDTDFWILMTGIIFTGFCIHGNLEIVTFGHPLWLCYYLGAGCWFAERQKV